MNLISRPPDLTAPLNSNPTFLTIHTDQWYPKSILPQTELFISILLSHVPDDFFFWQDHSSSDPDSTRKGSPPCPSSPVKKSRRFYSSLSSPPPLPSLSSTPLTCLSNMAIYSVYLFSIPLDKQSQADFSEALIGHLLPTEESPPPQPSTKALHILATTQLSKYTPQYHTSLCLPYRKLNNCILSWFSPKLHSPPTPWLCSCRSFHLFMSESYFSFEAQFKCSLTYKTLPD